MVTVAGWTSWTMVLWSATRWELFLLSRLRSSHLCCWRVMYDKILFGKKFKILKKQKIVLVCFSQKIKLFVKIFAKLHSKNNIFVPPLIVWRVFICLISQPSSLPASDRSMFAAPWVITIQYRYRKWGGGITVHIFSVWQLTPLGTRKQGVNCRWRFQW